ncbi:MAG: hypothetical protein IT210_07590 [Armatimonadetes bacterium]|nr:hypothetical protein [Armatimonadota bacterium]
MHKFSFCFILLLSVWTLAAAQQDRKAAGLSRPVILFWAPEPEKLRHATHITPQVWTPADKGSAERYKKESKYTLAAWTKRGVTPLRWMGYDKDKSAEELSDYWASALDLGYSGIAIDEIGHVSKEADARVADALTRLKKEHPELFVAVWHAGGLLPDLLRGYQEGADLVMLETYGIPYDRERYRNWITDRIRMTRKAGIIHKTVIALGINDESKPEDLAKIGSWTNDPAELESLLTLIRRDAPEMPGAAFFAPTASAKMRRTAENLAWKIFQKPAPLHGLIGDYDSELRRPDGRVDNDKMVARLKELGVNTYFWLIWHAKTDWEDLKLFLPRAARAGIDVWPYLVPPTEANPLPEPFRLDYKRWAEEIARLSVRHKNLKAWVIDDFYGNVNLFTPAYIRDMQARAKKINPNLAFLPLMYYFEINRNFVKQYRPVIDGVVVSYPQDRAQIQQASDMLNDRYYMMAGLIGYPPSTVSQPGQYGAATQTAALIPADQYLLRFQEQDDFPGPTAGYHFKQVLVDGEPVWEEDVAGGTPQWKAVEVDITDRVRDKSNVTITFRLMEKKGVGQFGVRWRLQNLEAEGLKLAADLSEPKKWQATSQGAFEVGFGETLKEGGGQFHIPFIVMTAGQAGEFRGRHGDPASPERMAEWVKMSLQTWKDGLSDGVVIYCLDKEDKSRIFDLTRELFKRYGQ